MFVTCSVTYMNFFILNMCVCVCVDESYKRSLVLNVCADFIQHTVFT